MIINKIEKKKHIPYRELAVPPDYKVKIKESEKSDKYLDLARELRKLLNIRVTVIPIVIGALGTIPKGLEKDWKGWKSTNRHHLHNNIVEIGQNTEKNPGDLRCLAVS